MLVLTGTNTYTGTTKIDASRTLRVGSNSAIGTGAITIDGTLDLNGYSQTLTKLTGEVQAILHRASPATLRLASATTLPSHTRFQGLSKMVPERSPLPS